jgi:hypothetical protein
MKKLIALILLTSSVCFAGPPGSPLSGGDRTFDSVTVGTVTIGDIITETGVEKNVWAATDSNGDTVASCTVECSVLTDGSQVCQIHFYVMSDTPGTLTEELTIDVDTD